MSKKPSARYRPINGQADNGPHKLSLREERLLTHEENSKTEPPKRRNLYIPRDLGMARRNKFTGISMDTIRSIHNRLIDGNKDAFGEWADLASHIIREDYQISSVYETRINSVAGKRFVIKSKGDPKVAEFVEDSLKQNHNLRRLYKELLHAGGLGYSALEHNWFNINGEWHSFPSQILPRDIAFGRNYEFEIRSWKDGTAANWIKPEKKPNKYILHAPGRVGETAVLSGYLLAVSKIWILKNWALIFQSDGLETYGNPKIYGKASEEASEEAINALINGIKDLGDDSRAVFLGETDIQIIESSKTVGDAFQQAIKAFDNAITKAILGSTLNVEIGSIGSKAAAESQADQTMLPRLEDDAKALESTIRNQWIKPLVEFNFPDGTEIPDIEFILVEPRKKNVDPKIVELGLKAGAISKNEIRAFAGLDPILEEQEEEVAQIQSEDLSEKENELLKNLLKEEGLENQDK